MKLRLKSLLGESLARHVYRTVGDLRPDECPIVNGRIAPEHSYDAISTWLRARLERATDQASPTDTRTARAIAASAGYELLGPFKSSKEYDYLRRYYRPGELLCKFGSDRPRTAHVFWFVSFDADRIEPEPRGQETRDGAYGTSVMSYEVSRANGMSRLCNRYNHTVAGCDNTLGSDLERIALGLTAAMERDYGIRIGRVGTEVPDAREIDGKLFFYEREIGGAELCYSTQSAVWQGRIWTRAEVVLIGPLIIPIREPWEAVNLASGAKPLAELPRDVRVRVHSDESAAIRAHEHEPDVLHLCPQVQP